MAKEATNKIRLLLVRVENQIDSIVVKDKGLFSSSSFCGLRTASPSLDQDSSKLQPKAQNLKETKL